MRSAGGSGEGALNAMPIAIPVFSANQNTSLELAKLTPMKETTSVAAKGWRSMLVPLGFRGLLHQIHDSRFDQRNESILVSYGHRAGVALDTVFEDFADRLVLDSRYGPPEGAGTDADKRERPVMLEASSPLWTERLFTFGDYSGDYAASS